MDQLLHRLEVYLAAGGSCAAAAPLLDCACALMFMLVCQWQHSLTHTGFSAEVASTAAPRSSAPQSAAEPPHVPQLSRCISIAASLSAAAANPGAYQSSSMPPATELAASIADWAPDLAAQQAVWRQLYDEAATAVGLSALDHTAEAFGTAFGSFQHPSRLVEGVADKVRAFWPVSEILPACPKANVQCRRNRFRSC